MRVEIDGVVYVPATDPVETRDTVGNLIRERREYLGLTASDLAKATGLERSRIFGIENVKNTPGLRIAYRISLALGLSMESLGACAQNGAAP